MGVVEVAGRGGVVALLAPPAAGAGPHLADEALGDELLEVVVGAVWGDAEARGDGKHLQGASLRRRLRAGWFR